MEKKFAFSHLISLKFTMITLLFLAKLLYDKCFTLSLQLDAAISSIEETKLYGGAENQRMILKFNLDEPKQAENSRIFEYIVTTPSEFKILSISLKDASGTPANLLKTERYYVPHNDLQFIPFEHTPLFQYDFITDECLIPYYYEYLGYMQKILNELGLSPTDIKTPNQNIETYYWIALALRRSYSRLINNINNFANENETWTFDCATEKLIDRHIPKYTCVNTNSTLHSGSIQTDDSFDRFNQNGRTKMVYSYVYEQSRTYLYHGEYTLDLTFNVPKNIDYNDNWKFMIFERNDDSLDLPYPMRLFNSDGVKLASAAISLNQINSYYGRYKLFLSVVPSLVNADITTNKLDVNLHISGLGQVAVRVIDRPTLVITFPGPCSTSNPTDEIEVDTCIKFSESICENLLKTQSLFQMCMTGTASTSDNNYQLFLINPTRTIENNITLYLQNLSGNFYMPTQRWRAILYHRNIAPFDMQVEKNLYSVLQSLKKKNECLEKILRNVWYDELRQHRAVQLYHMKDESKDNTSQYDTEFADFAISYEIISSSRSIALIRINIPQNLQQFAVLISAPFNIYLLDNNSLEKSSGKRWPWPPVEVHAMTSNKIVIDIGKLKKDTEYFLPLSIHNTSSQGQYDWEFNFRNISTGESIKNVVVTSLGSPSSLILWHDIPNILQNNENKILNFNFKLRPNPKVKTMYGLIIIPSIIVQHQCNVLVNEIPGISFKFTCQINALTMHISFETSATDSHLPDEHRLGFQLVVFEEYFSEDVAIHIKYEFENQKDVYEKNFHINMLTSNNDAYNDTVCLFGLRTKEIQVSPNQSGKEYALMCRIAKCNAPWEPAPPLWGEDTALEVMNIQTKNLLKHYTTNCRTSKYEASTTILSEMPDNCNFQTIHGVAIVVIHWQSLQLYFSNKYIDELKKIGSEYCEGSWLDCSYFRFVAPDMLDDLINPINGFKSINDNLLKSFAIRNEGLVGAVDRIIINIIEFLNSKLEEGTIFPDIGTSTSIVVVPAELAIAQERLLQVLEYQADKNKPETIDQTLWNDLVVLHVIGVFSESDDTEEIDEGPTIYRVPYLYFDAVERLTYISFSYTRLVSNSDEEKHKIVTSIQTLLSKHYYQSMPNIELINICYIPKAPESDDSHNFESISFDLIFKGQNVSTINLPITDNVLSTLETIPEIWEIEEHCPTINNFKKFRSTQI